MPTLLPFRPVIELAFDPIAQVGDWHVRLQTLALAAVILVALVLAAVIARRTPVDLSRSPDDAGPGGGRGRTTSAATTSCTSRSRRSPAR